MRSLLGHLLVTGGCGFVGANLVRHVAERGLARTIRVVDDESLGSRTAIAGAGAEFVRGDIRDTDLLRGALRGVDAVVHLAADTRVIDSIADPARNFDVNVVGTFRLLALMREAGVPRLVNASTGGAILGEAPPPVREDMAPHPGVALRGGEGQRRGVLLRLCPELRPARRLPALLERLRPAVVPQGQRGWRPSCAASSTTPR